MMMMMAMIMMMKLKKRTKEKMMYRQLGNQRNDLISLRHLVPKIDSKVFENHKE